MKCVHLQQYHTPQMEHSVSPAELGSLSKPYSHAPHANWTSLPAFLTWRFDSWVFDFPATVDIGNQNGVNVVVLGSQVATRKVAPSARDAVKARHVLGHLLS